MYYDLTKGRIGKCLIMFALPMIAGNLLQQFYNIADTLIVGRVLGKNALAAVGSAYTLMTFLTSVFLGLSMGSGALFSIYKGKGSDRELRLSVVHAFGLIMSVTVLLNVVVYLFTDPILWFLRVPEEVYDGMKTYLLVIFAGLVATSLYNFFSCLLRALGNSTVPLVFLAVRCPEYWAGSFVCGGSSLGDCRCGLCYGDRSVCVRNRDYHLCAAFLQRSSAWKRGALF